MLQGLSTGTCFNHNSIQQLEMSGPTASLSQLKSADGSATYCSSGYCIIGSVNGPIEVQRRDEIPDEAAVEVNIRPAAGVGSTDSIASASHTTH